MRWLCSQQIFALLFLMLLGNARCTQKPNPNDNTFYTYAREYIRTLDPIHAHDLFSHQLAAQIYEGLYHFHYLKRPIEVEPLIAEGLPEISENGTLYKIRIKKNIYFHDDPSFPGGKGRPLVAQDFIYSIKRLADPKNRSESYWVLENKIVGLDEWRAEVSKNPKVFSREISGLQAKDDHTLWLRLKKANYQFLQNLCMAATLIVPQEAVEYYGSEFGNHPVGTGAFRFNSWIPGSQIQLIKNSNYQSLKYPSQGTEEDRRQGLLEDTDKTLPLVDRVVIYEIPEPQPQWLMFMKGDLDTLQPHKDYQDEFIKDGKLNERALKKRIQLDLSLSTDVTYLGFNNENPFLKNKKVRQAMTLALDKDILREKFYNNLAIIAHGPIPPNLDGYHVPLSSIFANKNLSLAKKYLLEAGFPEGKGLPELNYEMSSTHATARQLSEFIQQQMAEIGIKIRLHPNTWAQFNEKVKMKKADLFDSSWNADYPDAENFLQLFYSKNISPGSNTANYNNPVFDQLYEKALRLPPGSERTKIYQTMEDILIEDAPWIYNVHRMRPVLKHSWLKNYKFEIMILDNMKYFRVNTSERALSKKKGL